jgi:hypothetical protein
MFSHDDAQLLILTLITQVVWYLLSRRNFQSICLTEQHHWILILNYIYSALNAKSPLFAPSFFVRDCFRSH